MAVMIVGGLLFAALVGWALTRNMNAPVSAPLVTETAETTPPVAIDTSTPSPASTADNKADVSRMTPYDLKQKMDRAEVTVVDVRAADAFALSHIPGSLNVPFARVEAEIGYLPKSKPIVLYCT
jgi:hypothetical protein